MNLLQKPVRLFFLDGDQHPSQRLGILEDRLELFRSRGFPDDVF